MISRPRQNTKYIKREWKNGQWVYTYPDEKPQSFKKVDGRDKLYNPTAVIKVKKKTPFDGIIKKTTSTVNKARSTIKKAKTNFDNEVDLAKKRRLKRIHDNMAVDAVKSDKAGYTLRTKVNTGEKIYRDVKLKDKDNYKKGKTYKNGNETYEFAEERSKLDKAIRKGARNLNKEVTKNAKKVGSKVKKAATDKIKEEYSKLSNEDKRKITKAYRTINPRKPGGYSKEESVNDYKKFNKALNGHKAKQQEIKDNRRQAQADSRKWKEENFNDDVKSKKVAKRSQKRTANERLNAQEEEIRRAKARQAKRQAKKAKRKKEQDIARAAWDKEYRRKVYSK